MLIGEHFGWEGVVDIEQAIKDAGAYSSQSPPSTQRYCQADGDYWPLTSILNLMGLSIILQTSSSASTAITHRS
jgi:hypothetical protein